MRACVLAHTPQSFKGVLLLFAGFLIFSSYKIITGARN
jgi:hypothetical protein